MKAIDPDFYQDYMSRVRQFHNDVESGKTDGGGFPMPNGKPLRNCTVKDARGAQDFFKQVITQLERDIKQFNDVIDILSDPALLRILKKRKG